MRTLVIVHVYYPQLWPELAACLKSISGPKDVVVTYGDEAAVTAVRAELPEATFIASENRGYDIWPFLKALGTVDFSRYDTVVKLHTKRDVPTPYCANNAYLGGDAWRKRLLAFVRTPGAWQKAAKRLVTDGVGMVADRHIIYEGNAQADDAEVWSAALAEVVALTGKKVSGGRYVAGSMFAVRAEVLRPLVAHLDRYAAEDFTAPEKGQFVTLAHVLERVLGLLVAVAGLRVEAFNGSVARRNAFYAERGMVNKLLRFFFWRRYVDGEVKIKICRIQIAHHDIMVS